jgi:phage baseplate assembly protein gpV
MRTGELSQRYFGHYLATVVDVNDPQHLGRIRVQADQFADTMDHPIWASISRPAAGDQQGVFFTPKNGDQVVISFISGDVREPIVVGYAHSTQKMPATSLVGTRKHGIVTTIGSVVFDEEGRTITVTFAGPIPSTITMTTAGISIQGAGTINIQAPNVVINGRVVAPQTRPI